MNIYEQKYEKNIFIYFTKYESIKDIFTLYETHIRRS